MRKEDGASCLRYSAWYFLRFSETLTFRQNTIKTAPWICSWTVSAYLHKLTLYTSISKSHLGIKIMQNRYFIFWLTFLHVLLLDYKCFNGSWPKYISDCLLPSTVTPLELSGHLVNNVDVLHCLWLNLAYSSWTISPSYPVSRSLSIKKVSILLICILMFWCCFVSFFFSVFNALYKALLIAFFVWNGLCK